jgi:hypothetical protein
MSKRRTATKSANAGVNVDRAVFQRGIAEYERRQDFLRRLLTEAVDREASTQLFDMAFDLFDYLLDHCRSDAEALTLLVQHDVKAHEVKVHEYRAPVADDIALALRLLNSIFGIARCDPAKIKRLLANARDRARQAAAQRGGQTTGADRRRAARDEHQRWAAEAKKLIETGKSPRAVSAIVACKHGKSAVAVRAALQSLGVISKRRPGQKKTQTR